MPPRSNYDLVDKILDGRLAFELRRMRADGLTFDQMAHAFSVRGIDISRETLRRWSKDQGEDASATGGTAA